MNVFLQNIQSYKNLWKHEYLGLKLEMTEVELLRLSSRSVVRVTDMFLWPPHILRCVATKIIKSIF